MENGIREAFDKIAEAVGRGTGSPYEQEYEEKKEEVADWSWPAAILELGVWVFGGKR